MFWPPAGGAYAVGVKFGPSGSLNVIDVGNMGEYVFMGGKWRSTCHDVPFVEQV